MPNGATEDLTVKFRADTVELKQLTAGLDTLEAQAKQLEAGFERTNTQYKKSMLTLQALEKQERELLELRKKETDPAMQTAYNKSLEQTAKRIADLRNQYNAELTIIDNLKTKQVQLKTAMDKATDPTQIKRLKTEIDGTTAATAKLEAGVQNVSGSFISMSTAVKAAGAIIAAEFALSNVKRFGEAVIDTTAEMQGLRKAIDFISHGQGETAFADLERQADKMGLSLLQLSRGFVAFSASVGDKMPLEAQLKLFEQINMGLSVMQVSEEKAGRAYVALSQMMSKGTVNAEELKGQLGDALPGALKLAAEAMGVTEKALLKMMEKGELLANDLLPRLGALMEKRFSGGVEAAALGLTASINREQSAWLTLRETIGNVVEPQYKAFMNTMTDWLGILSKSIAGQQLNADEAVRLSSAIDRLKSIVSIAAGLFFTMTTAGRALVGGIVNLIGSVRTLTVVYLQNVAAAGGGAMGMARMQAATVGLSSALRTLGGVLKGIGIGLAIAVLMKLYDVITKVDVVAERGAENLRSFNEALSEGKVSTEVEVDRLTRLFEVLKDVNSSQEQRAQAISVLNSKYGQYLNGLDLEHASIVQITRAQMAATAALQNHLETKVRTQLYEEQLAKNLKAKDALNAAVEQAKRLEAIYDARAESFFGRITNAFETGFETGVGGLMNESIIKVNLLMRDILDSSSAMDRLRGQGISNDMEAPVTPPIAPRDETEKQKKARAEREANEDALRRRLAELDEQLKEKKIENMANVQIARLKFNAATELAELESYKRRMAAEGKLTANMVETIGKIEQALIALFDYDVMDVLKEAELALVEKRNQEAIAKVKAKFIDGNIASETQMQEQIVALTLEAEQKKLDILERYDRDTIAQNAKVQDILVKQKQEAIEKAKRLEQEAFDARQRFLQQGDAEMQRQAIEREFKRRAEMQRAQNQRDGVNIDPETGQAKLTKEQNIVLKREELEAKRKLEEDYNQRIQQSGLRWGMQIQLLGMTLRQKELADLKKYYDERIALAQRAGESTVLIEAEKAAAIRAIEVKRIQQSLSSLQQEGQYLESAAQNTSQLVTNQAQSEINALETKYDKSINMARIKAERDAKYYGEGSKQAKKSANDLAHIEAEKQYRIQQAQEKAAREQEKIAIFNKALQIANATIATAQSVVGFLAVEPITPANIALSIAAGIAGALQVAAIVKTPIPKYAKGTPFVTGGQAGKDSVHAMLMPGERVQTAQENKLYWPTFEAIRMRKIPAMVMNEFATSFGQMAAGPMVRAYDQQPMLVPVMNDARIVQAIQEKEAVHVNVNADLQGFAVAVHRQNSRNTMLDKRFSYKG